MRCLGIRFSLLLLGSFITSFGFSDTTSLSGQIRVLGSAINQYVAIKAAKKNKSQKLCKNKVAKSLRSFVNLKLKVDGEMTGNCFQAQGFSVLAMPSGKKPMVGTLSKSSKGYVFTEESGKSVQLNRIPMALKNQLGKKLVLEADVSASGTEKSLKLISYIIYPKIEEKK